MASARLRIFGRVQGVGYRAWTVEMAVRLGLRGWVRNRIDGTVEAVIIGSDDAIATMIETCQQGPRAAGVREILVNDAEDDGSDGFRPLPTE